MAANRKTTQEAIVKKAISDAAFKKALMADPKATLEKELGIALPKGLKVEIVEETASTLYMVLPDVIKTDTLSDKELEAVAGGGPYKIESLKYDNKGACV